MKTNAKIEIEIFDNGCMKVSAEGEFSDLTVGFCVGVARMVQLESQNVNKTPEELLNFVTAGMRKTLGDILLKKKGLRIKNE